MKSPALDWMPINACQQSEPDAGGWPTLFSQRRVKGGVRGGEEGYETDIGEGLKLAHFAVLYFSVIWVVKHR